MALMAKEARRRVGRPTHRRPKVAVPPGLDRREQIVAVAGSLFAEKGYNRTSMRDIAEAAGLLSGSLYYYFSSKEELFLEVHGTGMKILTQATRSALEQGGDPWTRLGHLAAAHCRAVLENQGFMIMVFPEFPEEINEYHAEFVRQRDEYERIVSDTIGALDLPPDLDRGLYKLQFLGALNWSQTWYRAGGRFTPEDIGHHFVRMLRPR
ncbi:TetR family transcriptional regulator [Xanthobacter dioxanivorans]|uniref:TetR family transcriptional regulator n=1 Tax=Xanthobacter dioxanivorans TaxID=2528964 RepID=A0A974PTJ7_9HYPH|nr:TetR/AcrR family transcriptional regulator [Xanthobacter dioxanivorans]QRG08988.1 TetR family transcriptional regulator [Xanthobacter dioxanivorans]